MQLPEEGSPEDFKEAVLSFVPDDDYIGGLVWVHEQSTLICSAPSHMRRLSPTYWEILGWGRLALPYLFQDLIHRRPVERTVSMSFLMLLEDIVVYRLGIDLEREGFFDESSKRILPLLRFRKLSMVDYCERWIKWGVVQGYLTPEDIIHAYERGTA